MRKPAKRRIAVLSFAATLALVAGIAQAQTNPPAEQMPSHTDGNSSGTSPGGMGTTGWTNGLGNSHVGTSNSHTTGQVGASSSSPSSNQPEMATGEDLKGPPTRFPADKTPE